MLTSENTIAGKIAFLFLCLYAAGLSFSISIAQTGIGVVFVIFLFSLATRRGRASLNLAGATRLKLLYAGFFLWVFWRIYHIAVSPQPVRELIEAREVWLMLIPVFIYLYASDRKRLKTVVLCFVAGAAVSSAYGAWQMRADFWNMVRGRGLSNMHHLNYAGVTALATLMGLGLTWAFYYTGKKSAAFLTLLLTLCAAMGLWLTKSKGAIAPFLMVLPVFIYVQLYHWVQRWILIAAVAAAAVLLLPKVPQALVQEFKFPAPEIHLGSQAERRDLWQAGAAMVEERPVTGWGERGYNLAYPRFQVPGAVGVAKYDMPALEASHMHSDFLNTAVLYGIVGLLIQLFYYFFGAVLYWRERFKIRLMSDRPFAAAAAGCIPLMALMGVTQCHFTSEIVQMSFWLGVGALFSILESDRLTHGS